MGITIGLVLSFCSIGICVWVIVRHRICKQKRQTTATANIPSPNAMSLPPVCNTDLHEMQSLILKPTSPPLPNGNIKHFLRDNDVQKVCDKSVIATSPVIQLNENLKKDNDINSLKTDDFLDICTSVQLTKQSPIHQENGKKIRNGDRNHHLLNGSIDIPTSIPQSSHSNKSTSPLRSKLSNLPRIIENPQVCLNIYIFIL